MVKNWFVTSGTFGPSGNWASSNGYINSNFQKLEHHYNLKLEEKNMRVKFQNYHFIKNYVK